MLLEPLEPLTVKLPSGEIRELTPGTLVELPDDQAQRLLAKAPGRVRVVEPAADPPAHESVTVEPGSGRPVYWESADGSLRKGLAVLLARVGTGSAAIYWVGIEDAHGRLAWVHESRLRNRRQTEVNVAGERPTCSRCGAPPPLTWRDAALTCLRCEVPR